MSAPACICQVLVNSHKVATAGLISLRCVSACLTIPYALQSNIPFRISTISTPLKFLPNGTLG